MQNILRGLNDLQRKQVPFAMALALTTTAKDVQAALVKEIKDSFDRPTPMTLDSIYIQAAKKRDLDSVTVGIKDFMGKGIPASKYLAAQVTGGARKHKRSERALHIAGILPAGYSVVPGAGAPLDQYGNIQPSLIVQLLSYFKAFPEMGYKANMTDKRRAALARGNAKKGKQGVVYFVGRPGGKQFPLGIWARYTFAHGSAVKPILIFVESVTYEKRFEFHYTAQRTIDAVFERNLKAAWERAWATAKRV